MVEWFCRKMRLQVKDETDSELGQLRANQSESVKKLRQELDQQQRDEEKKIR